MPTEKKELTAFEEILVEGLDTIVETTADLVEVGQQIANALHPEDAVRLATAILAASQQD